MSASETLRLACLEDWQAATDHAFCRELANGSLPLDKMGWYLIQDYSFLENFVRLAASAVAQAPSLADAIPMAQFLGVVTGPENTYFQRSFEALGLDSARREATPLGETTLAFNALMAKAARSGHYAEIMAVLCVAEWSYLTWAAPHHPPKDSLPFYFGEWITLHAGREFEALVAYIRKQFDQAWESLDEAGQSQVAAVFTEAVALERRFFDDAYSWQGGAERPTSGA